MLLLWKWRYWYYRSDAVVGGDAIDGDAVDDDTLEDNAADDDPVDDDTGDGTALAWGIKNERDIDCILRQI